MAIVRDITVTLKAEDNISPATAPACPYCGRIDPEPSTHLDRVHDGDR